METIIAPLLSTAFVFYVLVIKPMKLSDWVERKGNNDETF